MAGRKVGRIEIDLDLFEIRIYFSDMSEPLTVVFNKPSRKFYLGIITLIVIRMKHLNDVSAYVRIKSYSKMVKLLDEGLSGNSTSKDSTARWEKVRRTWPHRLSDLADARCFAIKGRRKAVFWKDDEENTRKRYNCSDEEMEVWASLFDRKEDNAWLYTFAVDNAGLKLKDVRILYAGEKDTEAWKKFEEYLKLKLNNEKPIFSNDSADQKVLANERTDRDPLDELKDQNEQIRAFLKEVVGRYQYMPLLWLENEILLEESYVPIRVTLERRYFHEIEPSLMRKLDTSEKSASWDEVRDNSRIMVLAHPGMGKSTLLKREAKAVAEEGLKILNSENCDIKSLVFPLFLRLDALQKTIEEQRGDIFESIIQLACTQHRWTLSHIREILEKKLAEGKCLLLLDCLDEVPTEHRNELEKRIADFSCGYEGRIICASRIVGYGGDFLDGAKDIEIIPFDSVQINQYVEGLFQNAATKLRNNLASHTEFLKELENESQLSKIAQNPLLLSILCRLYQENRLSLPARRSKVYEMAAIHMLAWSKQRDFKLKKGISSKKRLLEEIAYRFMIQGKELFSEDILDETIGNYLQEKGIPKDLSKYTESELREELTEEYGIIKKLHEDSDRYLFVHRIFQEYFSASYLKRAIERNLGAGIQLATKHIWDFDWHETLCLLAGLLDDPFPLLEAIMYEEVGKMRTRRKDDIFNTLIALAAKCVAECESSSSPIFVEIINELLEVLRTDPGLHYCEGHNSYCSGRRGGNYPDFLRKYLLLTGSVFDVELAFLSIQSTSEIIPILIEALKDEDTRVRDAATDALCKIGTAEAVLALKMALKDQDAWLRVDAVKALSGIKSRPEATPILIEALKDEDTRVRYATANALWEMGTPEAILGLKMALKDQDAEVRVSTVKSLFLRKTSEATPILIEALKDKDARVRNAATDALCQIDTPEAILALKMALKDEDAEVRLNAACTLRADAPEGTPILLEALKNQDAEVRDRRRASYALADLKTPEAILALKMALKDEDAEVRVVSADALREIGAPEATSVLLEILKDQNAEITPRTRASNALAKIGTPETILALEMALKDQDGQLGHAAAYALAKIKTPEALLALKKTLKDVDTRVKVRGVHGLRYIGMPEATHVLIEALKDQDAEIRAEAATALGKIGTPEASLALLEAQSDQDAEVNVSMAHALGENRKPEAIPDLLEALVDDRLWVKRQAASALAKHNEARVIKDILRTPEIYIYDLVIQPIILNLLRKLVIRHRKEKNSLHPLYPEKVEKYRSEKCFADNGEQ